MSPPDETPRAAHCPVAATAYTVLPLTLLLALIAWIYPVLQHHHPPQLPAPAATAPATPP
ncbi:hypothetical protein ACFP3U_04885 [Kitasatospora misakiensis]|uniref:Uncharacterized protein n=1 Tax=Kitasatospora misakiensis TaxID=67330 RepID=A0ABW0WXN2_9ACTN